MNLCPLVHVLTHEPCACVSCSVSCNLVPHFPGCPCGLGPRPCSHGPVPARCLPPWAAGAPAPAYHSCLRASAWPHRIPGATCPLLLPPLALTGPWALPPPGTGWHSPLSGPPSHGRINRILSQPPVPVWAHLWVDNDCPCLCKEQAHPLTRGHWQGNREAGQQAGWWVSQLCPQHQPPGGLAQSSQGTFGLCQAMLVACEQDSAGSAGEHALSVTWQAAVNGQSGELPYPRGWAWETVLWGP